jgi:beta-glucosidase
VADVLLGRVNPSGRLSMTVPQSAGHIPTVHDYKPSGRGFYHKPGSETQLGRDYVFASPAPLWPFGFGLSYTTFRYSDLQIETPVIPADGEVRLRFTVQHTGSRPGKDVPQVYLRDDVPCVSGGRCSNNTLIFPAIFRLNLANATGLHRGLLRYVLHAPRPS